jgi:hypothetical protein
MEAAKVGGGTKLTPTNVDGDCRRGEVIFDYIKDNRRNNTGSLELKAKMYECMLVDRE